MVSTRFVLSNPVVNAKSVNEILINLNVLCSRYDKQTSSESICTCTFYIVHVKYLMLMYYPFSEKKVSAVLDQMAVFLKHMIVLRQLCYACHFYLILN